MAVFQSLEKARWWTRRNRKRGEENRKSNTGEGECKTRYPTRDGDSRNARRSKAWGINDAIYAEKKNEKEKPKRGGGDSEEREEREIKAEKEEKDGTRWWIDGGKLTEKR